MLAAVHHIRFYVLQTSDANVFTFEEGHVTFSILIIHALFVIAEGIVLSFMALDSEIRQVRF